MRTSASDTFGLASAHADHRIGLKNPVLDPCPDAALPSLPQHLLRGLAVREIEFLVEAIELLDGHAHTCRTDTNRIGSTSMERRTEMRKRGNWTSRARARLNDDGPGRDVERRPGARAFAERLHDAAEPIRPFRRRPARPERREIGRLGGAGLEGIGQLLERGGHDTEPGGIAVEGGHEGGQRGPVAPRGIGNVCSGVGSARIARKDTAAIREFYTEDAIYAPQDRPPARGRDAVAAMWATGEFTLEDMSLERTPIHIEVAKSGDVATEIGTWVFSAKRQGKPFEGKGNYIFAWRKEGGAWKASAYMWNVGQPSYRVRQ
jgi:ketosteroid isomerase-like protein